MATLRTLLSTVFLFFVFSTPAFATHKKVASTPAAEPAHNSRAWSGAPKNFYFDVTLGAHTPTLSGIGTGFAYGFNFGYKLDEKVSLGVYLNRSSREPVDGLTVSLMPFGAEVTYYPETNLLVGLQVGPTIETGSFGSLSASDTEFSLGPKFGISFPVSESFTLGFEPGAMIVFGETTYAILNFPLVAKVWF